MTWPASLTLVTVTHSPVIGGQKPAGHVKVEPASRMWATADGASVLPAELELVPVVDGTYTFQVPAVDDPELTGADLTYWVTELFPGGSRRLRIAPTMAHAAAPVDLYEVLTDAPIPGGTQAFIDQVQASLTTTIRAEVDASLQAAVDDTGAGGLADKQFVTDAVAQGGGGGTTLIEDPDTPGLYLFSSTLLSEDPTAPGLYLIGA